MAWHQLAIALLVATSCTDVREPPRRPSNPREPELEVSGELPQVARDYEMLPEIRAHWSRDVQSTECHDNLDTAQEQLGRDPFTGITAARRILLGPYPDECKTRATAIFCEAALRLTARSGRVPSARQVTDVQCRAYLRDADIERTLVTAATITWPARSRRGPDVWIRTAELASHALPHPASAELTVTAVENYLKATDCLDPDKLAMQEIGRRLSRIAGERQPARRWARVEPMSRLDVTRDECRRRLR